MNRKNVKRGVILGVLISVALMNFYYWIFASVVPLKIKIVSENYIEIDSKIVDINQLKNIARTYRDKGCEGFVVLGGERERNEVFWRIHSECSEENLFECSISYNGSIIPIYAGSLYAMFSPSSLTPLNDDPVLKVIIEKDMVFVGREYDENGNIIKKGDSLDIANLKDEIQRKTKQGKLQLEVICDSSTALHLTFLEVIYAYHIAGGKYIFVART